MFFRWLEYIHLDTYLYLTSDSKMLEMKYFSVIIEDAILSDLWYYEETAEIAKSTPFRNNFS